MRDRLIRFAPALFSGAVVLALFAPLLRPGTLLAVRDVPIFHLPLRSAFAALAREGLPAWNPWIHGGQPLLSNPNYAAFYPPSWLALALPVHTSIHLILFGHALLGLAGAWALARRLGCERPAAAATAIAFAAGGAFVATSSWIPGFCGLAWLPWILRQAAACFDAGGGAETTRRAIATAALLALQFLAGEPVLVMITGLALACMALARSRRPAAVARLGIVAALAMALAAVQLLPTLARLSDSERATGLATAEAATWSTSPARLTELALPRLHGDPNRSEEGLYFGWKLHDRGYPYLVSIYPGLLVLLLGLAALLRWPIPLRGALAAMLLVGVFLALGRHNPLLAWLTEAAPALRILRYPEKFLLLTTTALALAAGLGWQHMLERRRAGHHRELDFALALSVAATLGFAALLALISLRPELPAWFVRSRSPLPPAPAELAAAVGYLRREGMIALATAVAATLVIAGHRWPRPPERWLAALLLTLVAADLGYQGRTLLPTVEFARLLEPGGELERLEAGERLFTDAAFVAHPDLVLASGRPGPARLWSAVDRLDPYIANLRSAAYVLNADTDLMLTGPARSSLATLGGLWRQRPLAERYLGAWAVDRIVYNKPLAEVLRQRWRGEPAELVTSVTSRERLEPVRWVGRVTFHADLAAATAAAKAAGWRIGEHDHWLGAAGTATARTARIVDSRAGGRRLSLRLSAPEGGLLVVASTFDRGWRARADGRHAPLYATAAGQIGVLVPAATETLELAYWDRWVTAGTLLTFAGLAGCALAWRRTAGGATP